MKRWIWLAVLPWTVVLPENQEKNCIGMNGPAPCVGITASYKGRPAYDCLDKDSCQDFVEALNEAHERRTHKMESGEGYAYPTFSDPGLTPEAK